MPVGDPAVGCIALAPSHLCVMCLQVLAVVSQASVAFVFFFALVVAVICFSPIHNAGARSSAVHAVQTATP